MRGKARTVKEKYELIRSLEHYFKLGYSLNKACELAGIPTSTAHDIINENESLRINMHAMQNLVTTKARQAVVQKIEDGDVTTAKWWLERKEPSEFQGRQKVETDIPFVNLGELRRYAEERKAKVTRS